MRRRLCSVCKSLLPIGLLMLFALTSAAASPVVLIDGSLLLIGSETDKKPVKGNGFDVPKDITHLFEVTDLDGADLRLLVAREVGDVGIYDLWTIELNKGLRRIGSNAVEATSSRDGKHIAFTDANATLTVVDAEGKGLISIAGAFNPNWSPSGSSVAFSKVREGDDPFAPEVLQIATVDVATQKVTTLTEERYDDARPVFHPSGNWILFESTIRSGTRSFWKVPLNGQAPTQITNIDPKVAAAESIPTSSQQGFWSSDGRWFVYEYSIRGAHQIWALEFGKAGAFTRAAKLGDGASPQWLVNGKSVLVQQQIDDTGRAVPLSLP
jgi:hypothetical protein